MTIGFFDSGIGGVSVLAEAMRLLPGQDYLFDADMDHVPYGERDASEIARYTMDNARFLLSLGAEALVVACNTATAVAINELRRITDVPVIGMEPAVKPAVEGSKAGRVLVTATPVTLREAKLKDLLHRVDGCHRVDLLPLPGLVDLAERGEFDSAPAREYLRHALEAVDPADYAALVLGCTHFYYFKPLFRELLGPQIRLVDGNEGTVRRLSELTGLPIFMVADPESVSDPDGTPDPEGGGSVRWFHSGRPVTDPERIRFYQGLCERVKIIKNI